MLLLACSRYTVPFHYLNCYCFAIFMIFTIFMIFMIFTIDLHDLHDSHYLNYFHHSYSAPNSSYSSVGSRPRILTFHLASSRWLECTAQRSFSSMSQRRCKHSEPSAAGAEDPRRRRRSQRQLRRTPELSVEPVVLPTPPPPCTPGTVPPAGSTTRAPLSPAELECATGLMTLQLPVPPVHPLMVESDGGSTTRAPLSSTMLDCAAALIALRSPVLPPPPLQPVPAPRQEDAHLRRASGRGKCWGERTR